MPSIGELVRAFDDSMLFLEVPDDLGGPDVERIWWRVESGPLYWLYRIDQLQEEPARPRGILEGPT